jgi:hypothetical protein
MPATIEKTFEQQLYDKIRTLLSKYEFVEAEDVKVGVQGTTVTFERQHRHGRRTAAGRRVHTHGTGRRERGEQSSGANIPENSDIAPAIKQFSPANGKLPHL